ncbi:hypothetical protein TKK_0015933 [Trichogramma kaykai]|uniref:Uncharacterized protein n=1 Tax=Trichogramma kaykai TaxID=54128 RepID=A0ABD2W915_9HYME
MFPRYFFVFGLLLFFCVILKARAYQDDLENQAPEDRSFITKALEKLARKGLEGAFGEKLGGAASSCIEAAIEQCKQELRHIKKMIKCAGQYFKEDEGECLIP